MESRLRPVCDACGHIVFLNPKLAVAVVIAREGRVLLGKRAAHTRSPGKWSFPAGFVDQGEVVANAAIREVREETGLIVQLSPVLGLLSHEGDPTVLAVFAATDIIGEPVASDDLTALDWFDPDELPDLAFDHDLDIVTMWKRWLADA